MSDSAAVYLALSRALMADARETREPVQRLVAYELAGETNWTRSEVTAYDGRRVAVDPGEALIGQRAFAERHGLDRFAVRRT